MKGITIPNSVTSIGNQAFNGCSGLTKIIGHANAVSAVAKQCTSKAFEVVVTGVTSIGERAFTDCIGLTSVTIGSGVTSIGSWAFEGCYRLIEVFNKSSLTISSGSNNNGYVAYYAKNVYTTEGGSKLATDENGYVIYTDGDEKILVAYTGTETDITLPSDITQILNYAFYNCSDLMSVTIPNSVTSIGNYAFYNCSSLTSVTIGNSVTSIGSFAFSDCKRLTSITIPNGVTSIGDGAFSRCSGLTSIAIPDSVTIIGRVAFSNTGWYWKQPDGLVYAGKVAYEYKGTMSSNTSIVIKEGTLGIADSAFSGCSGLTSITIPNSVTSIGKLAFSGCRGLTSVTIGNSVTSIGKEAFRGCTGLTTVNWNATKCTSAGSSDYPIFSGCTNLKTVNIGENVKTIPSYAFRDCSGLTSVTIPDSVTSIGAGAFSGCYRLVEVYNKSALSITAGNYDNGAVAYYAKNVYTNEGGSKLTTDENGYVIYTDGDEKILVAYHGTNTELVLPSYITEINRYAFYKCTGLTSVTIGNSVTSIGYDAFYGCTGLTSVTIPDSVTSIGLSAFSYCTGLTSIAFNGTIAQWNAISKSSYWKSGVPATEVVCKDGTVSI